MSEPDDHASRLRQITDKQRSKATNQIFDEDLLTAKIDGLINEAVTSTAGHEKLGTRHGQQFLDPRKVAAPAEPKCTRKKTDLKSPKEDAALSFSYVPDAFHLGDTIRNDQMQPGDLLLFSRIPTASETDPRRRKSIAVSQYVRRINRDLFRFPPEHAHWNHAAVYLINGYILDTTHNGVERARLYEHYVGEGNEHLIRVRRCKGRAAFGGLQTAAWSLDFEGTRYDVQAGARMIRFVSEPEPRRYPSGWYQNARPIEIGTTICSQLFAMNYGHVSGQWIRSGMEPSSYISTAALSASEHLRDVPVKWLPLVP